MDTNYLIEEILRQKQDKKKLSSELGFFSKPMRINDLNGKEFIVKLYRPLKSDKLCQDIISNHDAYIVELKKLGINVPETIILTKKIENKNQLIIVQRAFSETELVRNQLESANEQYFLEILKNLLDITIEFWKYKPTSLIIGFHPTLRNFAFRDRQLYYFDTFPPMLMDQYELNKLIINMAPVKINIRAFIPTRTINRVSDEYYKTDKMITGIIGSCCRLRPELCEVILKFSRTYITSNKILQRNEQEKVLRQITNPPKLSGTWITFRKFFGKIGKPNVN